MNDGTAIEEEGNPFLVAAPVGDPIGVNYTPLRTEIAEGAAQVSEIVAEFDESDKIELAQNLGDVMNGRFGAVNAAEFADVPDGDVDGFIQL